MLFTCKGTVVDIEFIFLVGSYYFKEEKTTSLSGPFIGFISTCKNNFLEACKFKLCCCGWNLQQFFQPDFFSVNIILMLA